MENKENDEMLGSQVEKENAKLKRTVAGYKGQVKSLQNRIGELEVAASMNEQKASILERTVKDRDVRIDALQRRLDIMEQQNASMLEELNETNAIKTTLEAEVKRYRSLPWYRRIFD
jgi:predicted RNase H-like nuclease (RuvC/YqgF family)